VIAIPGSEVVSLMDRKHLINVKKLKGKPYYGKGV